MVLFAYVGHKEFHNHWLRVVELVCIYLHMLINCSNKQHTSNTAKAAYLGSLHGVTERLTMGGNLMVK